MRNIILFLFEEEENFTYESESCEYNVFLLQSSFNHSSKIHDNKLSNLSLFHFIWDVVILILLINFFIQYWKVQGGDVYRYWEIVPVPMIGWTDSSANLDVLSISDIVQFAGDSKLLDKIWKNLSKYRDAVSIFWCTIYFICWMYISSRPKGKLTKQKLVLPTYIQFPWRTDTDGA